MPDLRELISERLDEVADKAWSEFTRTAAPIEWVDLVRNAVADECIRQMEWARRRGMFTEEKIGEPVSAMSLGFPSPAVFGPTIKRTAIGLTLAPDDWTPNKET